MTSPSLLTAVSVAAMVFYTEMDGLATRYELVVEETKRPGSVIAAKEKGKRRQRRRKELEWWICQRSFLRGQTPHCVACTEEGSIEKPTNDERRSVNVRYRYNPSRTDAAGGCRYRLVLPDKSRHGWHLHDRVVWQLLQVKASIQQYKRSQV